MFLCMLYRVCVYVCCIVYVSVCLFVCVLCCVCVYVRLLYCVCILFCMCMVPDLTVFYRELEKQCQLQVTVYVYSVPRMMT